MKFVFVVQSNEISIGFQFNMALGFAAEASSPKFLLKYQWRHRKSKKYTSSPDPNT